MKTIKALVSTMLSTVLLIPQSLDKVLSRKVKIVSMDTTLNAENSTTDTGGAECCIAEPEKF